MDRNAATQERTNEQECLMCVGGCSPIYTTRRSSAHREAGYDRAQARPDLYLDDLHDARHGVPLVVSPRDPVFVSLVGTPAGNPTQPLAAEDPFSSWRGGLISRVY
jgi:hypothetical protein